MYLVIEFVCFNSKYPSLTVVEECLQLASGRVRRRATVSFSKGEGGGEEEEEENGEENGGECEGEYDE